jgi:hypothetical protein
MHNVKANIINLKVNNKENNVKTDTSIAKDEHISQGNKLGIIDRLVRTLKEMIDRYRIAVSKQTSFSTKLL